MSLADSKPIFSSRVSRVVSEVLLNKYGVQVEPTKEREVSDLRDVVLCFRTCMRRTSNGAGSQFFCSKSHHLNKIRRFDAGC